MIDQVPLDCLASADQLQATLPNGTGIALANPDVHIKYIVAENVSVSSEFIDKSSSPGESEVVLISEYGYWLSSPVIAEHVVVVPAINFEVPLVAICTH
jgi:hypothetical protein